MKKLACVAQALCEYFQTQIGNPYVVVDKTSPGAVLPVLPTAKKDSKEIVFNLGVQAIVDLQFLEQGVSFTARFNTIPFTVFIPYPAIRAIFPLNHEEDVVYFNFNRVEDASKGQTFHTETINFYMQDVGQPKFLPAQQPFPKNLIPNKPNLKLIWNNPVEPDRPKLRIKPELKLITNKDEIQ
jgi:stringent starvation protein B